MTTAYRKVPCEHKPCHGDGTEKYGLVSCTAVHEVHCQGLHDLDPCPGFTYEPWPEVEAELEEAKAEARKWSDEWGTAVDRMELTHYRSIGTPEQIEAVVEAAGKMHDPDCEAEFYAKPCQPEQTIKCFACAFTTALTTLKGSE